MLFCSLDGALEMDMDKNRKHSIEVIVGDKEKDSDDKKKENFKIARQSTEIGDGEVVVYDIEKQRDYNYSEKFSLPQMQYGLMPIENNIFLLILRLVPVVPVAAWG